MHNKEVVLIVRRNKEYWLYNEYKSPLNSWLIDIMNLWDHSFKMNIVDFRNKIRDISSSLYVKNKFDKIFLHSNKDLRVFSPAVSMEELNIYKRSIFVPMDEDDWIDPSLSEELRNTETDKSVFIWNHFATIYQKEINSDKREQAKNHQPERTHFAQSCSWGCVGYSCLLSKRNNLYINKKEYMDAYFINKPLTVKVEHVGSLGFLRKTIKQYKDQKEEWINNIVKKLIADIKIDHVDFSKIYKDEWHKYKNVLKELLESYKYLVLEQKEIL